MSMNIQIKAVAKAMIIETGEEFDHSVNLPVMQTPTEVTERIMNSENKIKEYENYIRSIFFEEEEPVFAEDDLFQEKEPIGYKTVNMGKEHLAELCNDITYYTNKGYEIVFEMI